MIDKTRGIIEYRSIKEGTYNVPLYVFLKSTYLISHMFYLKGGRFIEEGVWRIGWQEYITDLPADYVKLACLLDSRCLEVSYIPRRYNLFRPGEYTIHSLSERIIKTNVNDCITVIWI